MRIIAVDWSGSVAGPRKKIWRADVVSGRVERLESGRDRWETADALMEAAKRDDELVVGLDFAFSFPAWYVAALGAVSGRDVWRIAEEQGEDWLKACRPPFWGRPGTKKPAGQEHLRRTEREVQDRFNAPAKSVFQVGGAGAVGTGSIRGMPVLARLAAAGFAIWPFDAPAFPLVVEIYPRLLTGPVVKSDPMARFDHLADAFPELGERERVWATCSEDAFDAAVSAIAMWRHRQELRGPEQARDDVERLEGRIWHPDAS